MHLRWLKHISGELGQMSAFLTNFLKPQKYLQLQFDTMQFFGP